MSSIKTILKDFYLSNLRVREEMQTDTQYNLVEHEDRVGIC